jgi:hypothetical protein
MATPANSIRTGSTELAKRWEESIAAEAQTNSFNNDIANGTAQPKAGPNLPRALPEKIWPIPKPRLGYPGKARGAIYALDPIDHSRGDALFFSRYPETLNEKIESMLATENAPGRAYPTFQKMGAKGINISVELWFCDAFLWSLQATDQLDRRVGNSKVALAELARQFFKAYMVGHDGTGVAVPPADMYLHWGGTDHAVPVVINSVQLKSEMFTSPGGKRFQADLPGVPQLVSASVEMQVYMPLLVTDPFRPKRIIPPVKKKPTQIMCGETGKDESGRSYIDIGGVKYFRDAAPVLQSTSGGGGGGGGLPYTVDR